MKGKFKTGIITDPEHKPQGYVEISSDPPKDYNTVRYGVEIGVVPSVKLMAHAGDIRGPLFVEKESADAFLAKIRAKAEPAAKAVDSPKPDNIDADLIIGTLNRQQQFLTDIAQRTIAINEKVEQMLRMWSTPASNPTQPETNQNHVA